MKGYIQDCLRKLQALGIDVLDKEQYLIDCVMKMPSDMLADLEKYQILGLLLDTIDSDKLYSFDTEVMDIENMYSVFLQRMVELTEGDLEISNVTENMDAEALETGKGIHTVQFCCNQKKYRYDAQAHYDWFDTEILSLMSRVIEDSNTGKSLLACSDGWENCILFYETEEWMQNFNRIMDTKLEKA